MNVLLLVVEMARRAWYRHQHRAQWLDERHSYVEAEDEHTLANQAYAHYRESAQEFEQRTGDTRYHSHNTTDDQRRAWLANREV